MRCSWSRIGGSGSERVSLRLELDTEPVHETLGDAAGARFASEGIPVVAAGCENEPASVRVSDGDDCSACGEMGES